MDAGYSDILVNFGLASLVSCRTWPDRSLVYVWVRVRVWYSYIPGHRFPCGGWQEWFHPVIVVVSHQTDWLTAIINVSLISFGCYKFQYLQSLGVLLHFMAAHAYAWKAVIFCSDPFSLFSNAIIRHHRTELNQILPCVWEWARFENGHPKFGVPSLKSGAEKLPMINKC